MCFPTSCVERVCAVAVTGRSSAVGTTGLLQFVTKELVVKERVKTADWGLIASPGG